MQHTVDSKRQFLSNKIKLKRLKKQVYSSKSWENLKKIWAQISGKVKKIKAQEKKCFSYK